MDVNPPQPGDKSAIPVSALCGSGIADLWKKIENSVLSLSHAGSDVLVNTARQKESLQLCLDSMLHTKTYLENGSHELELAAFELGSAIGSLESFLGKITSQDVLDRVFANFATPIGALS